MTEFSVERYNLPDDLEENFFELLSKFEEDIAKKTGIPQIIAASSAISMIETLTEMAKDALQRIIEEDQNKPKIKLDS